MSAFPKRSKTMVNKNYIIIGVIGVALLLLAVFMFRPASFGGSTHLSGEQFVPGLVVGGSSQPGCMKVADRDSGGGFTYITWQDGVQYITGGTAAALAAGTWAIPSACSSTGLDTIDLQSR